MPGTAGQPTAADQLVPFPPGGWRLEGLPDRALLREAVERLHRRSLGRARPAGAPARIPVPVLRSFLIATEPAAEAVLRYELTRPADPADDVAWRPVFVAVRDRALAFLGIALRAPAARAAAECERLAGELSAVYNALAAGRDPRTVPAADGRAPGGLALAGIRARPVPVRQRSGGA